MRREICEICEICETVWNILSQKSRGTLLATYSTLTVATTTESERISSFSSMNGG